MKQAGIFPGQGSEYPGMALCVGEHEITQQVFHRIREISGMDVLSAATGTSPDGLRDPVVAQLAVLGTSVSYWGLLRAGEEFSGLAGHSMGFYAALHAAGSLDLDEAILMVLEAHRAIITASAGRPGRMAAVIGLKTQEVEELCRLRDTVYVSNVNSATQIVISGAPHEVRSVCDEALGAGALSVKELPIPFALHCPLMEGVGDLLEDFVGGLEVRQPAVPVISHLDGILLDRQGIKEVLRFQLSRPVLWRDTVTRFLGMGVSGFLEMGPSNVLSKLVRWIARDAECRTAEEVMNCQGA